ncbi:uncharacterized protein [Clytia hemisphaerica]|uniref:uncharacterized protein n=1 Tax=Clytia hemisphaerica TaxID=252671 RepID=UPI0034D472BB
MAKDLKRPKSAVQSNLCDQGKDFIRPAKKMIDDKRWTGTWNISADLPEQQSSFVIPTTKKPDIVVWCTERKVVFLVELTVPHEDNINAAQVRKDYRYEELLEKCEDAGQDATHHSVEVGCRGFVGNRLKKWLINIGLPKRTINKSIKELEEVTEKASHWIWLKRNDEFWQEE